MCTAFAWYMPVGMRQAWSDPVAYRWSEGEPLSDDRFVTS